MKETLKTIGKKSEKIGNTTVTGEGAVVKMIEKDPDTVAVRDYVSSKGYSGIVHWDGENPSVAGIKIKPTEIKDGIAYAKKSEVDQVIADMEKSNGIKNAEKSREEKYGATENKLFNDVINRKSFSYDPQTDVVYQAYKKQYEREAEHALRKILNDNNSSVSTASGAVLSEAIAAYNEKMDKVTDVIPDLYKDAYSRYTDEGKTLDSNLKTINDIANDYYDRVYKSNTDSVKRISDSGKAERDERYAQSKEQHDEEQRIIENEREAVNDAYENAIKGIKAEYYADELQADIAKSNATAESTALKNAIARGFFIESDEKIMPWLSEYRLPDGSYSISPDVAGLAYEYQSAKVKERGKIHAKLGL